MARPIAASVATPTAALRAEALGARLPPLVVAAERVAATVLQGVHGRRRAGRGDAFWQFRPHRPGESAGRIDWRQSARSDRLYERETEWEAAQTVGLWRDASPSMDWRSAAALPTKHDRAELLLLALGSLLLRGGERVRLLAGDARSHAGRTGLPALAEELSRATDPAGLPPPDPRLPRHARAVLFGDFWAPLPQLAATLAGFAAAGVRGHLVAVADPTEETLPWPGRVRFEGLESDEAHALVPRVEGVRALYAERLRNHRAGVEAAAAAAGWRVLRHRTDHPPGGALLALWQALAGEGARRG